MKLTKMATVDCTRVGEVDEVLCLFPCNEMGDVIVVVDRVLDPTGLGVDVTDIPLWLRFMAEQSSDKQIYYIWLQATWPERRL